MISEKINRKKNKMERNLKNTIESLLTPIIPFAMLNRKIFKNFSEDKKAVNFISSIMGFGLLSVYFASSISYRAPMFSKKWYENRREITQQQIMDIYHQEFRELDKNPYDGVVDSIEFIYRE